VAWCAACGNFGHTAEKCPSEIKSFAIVGRRRYSAEGATGQDFAEGT